jgi:hypothetical protein
MGFGSQIGRHSVAIISLFVALSALGYNTWRNEESEQNRTIRRAGFEMLVHVAELQRIAYLAHYDNDEIGGSPRKGWVEVLVLRDLATLMPPPGEAKADQLHAVWSQNWSGLGKAPESIDAIEVAIDDLRTSVVAIIESLD